MQTRRVICGRVIINGKIAKASTAVKCGDIVEIKFGEKIIKFEITKIDEVVKKEAATEMFKMIEE